MIAMTNKIANFSFLRRCKWPRPCSLRLMALLGLVVFSTNGCMAGNAVQDKKDAFLSKLPEPVYATPAKPARKQLALSADLQAQTEAMVAQVRISCGEKVACTKDDLENYQAAIFEATSFLIGKFGMGRYVGQIDFIVSRDPNVNGKMLSTSKKNVARKVQMNVLNMHPSEWRVIVHELFHAFYQDDSFMQRNPDFVTEGMAVYVEYLYRHRDKSKKAILAIMKEHAKSLGYKKGGLAIDYDTGFIHYQGRTLDLMYVIGGLFFMEQDDAAMANALQKMWLADGRKSNREPFDNLIDKYALEANEYAMLRDQLPPAIATTAGIQNNDSNITNNFCDLASIRDRNLLAFLNAVMDKKQYKTWSKKNCKKK
jgi:hypothetical protein